MQPIQPYPVISGDNEARIMARSIELVGFSRTRFVWRAGFLRDSEAAKAYGVCAPEFTFYLCNQSGKILAQFNGMAFNLPSRFKEVIAAVM